MYIVYIVLGVILGILILCFFFAFTIHRKIFGKRWEPNGITKYYEASSYEGLEVLSLEIPTQGGMLRGNIYRYSSCNKGILVFSHGMWGSHKAYIQEIELLAREGYQVIGFDYYGTELSDGRNIKGLGNSLKSLDEAISYIQKTYPLEEISVFGHSWGGFAALCIAKYHLDLHKVVAMSPFLSLSRIFHHLLPKLLLPVVPFLVWIDSFYCGKYSFANAVKILKQSHVDTLILHSKDDHMVPYPQSTGYLQQKGMKKNVLYDIVDGKKHNPDYTYEALAYTEECSTKGKEITDKTEKIEYLKSLDYHKMGEIDLEVFSRILDFLKNESNYDINKDKGK
ncbi:alpha/beta hydrolase [bacterium]|nr:alpha/beta hydrolase [bacterium]